MGWILFLLGCAGAYLLGAMPTAYLLGKWKKGIDIRDHGSGNVGATNAFRVMGKLPGIVVLGVDIGKGVLSVTVLSALIQPISPLQLDWLTAILGTLAIAGHIWTPFLKFQGGKGVATSLGVFLCLDPYSTLAATASWVITLFLFRYVSVSSMVGAIVLPLVMAFWMRPFPWILGSSLVCLAICYKHKPNIQRLLVGSEKKIGKP